MESPSPQNILVVYINTHSKLWEILSKACYAIFRFCTVFRFFWVLEICFNIPLIYKWTDWMTSVLVRGFFLAFCPGPGIVCCVDKDSNSKTNVRRRLSQTASPLTTMDLLVGFLKNNVYVNKFPCLLYLVVLWVGSLCNVKGPLNHVLSCNLKTQSLYYP